MVETYAQLFHTKVTISNTLHICCLFQFTTKLYIKLKFGKYKKYMFTSPTLATQLSDKFP